MDRVPDGGVDWRREITPLLNEMGVIVFDPSSKPMKHGIADETDVQGRLDRASWVARGLWDRIRRFMKRVRAVDLRMINVCDFVIMRVDPDVHMCGSYEENAIANHEKKPILVWTVGGKGRTPWWLFGMIPHEMIFGDLADLMAYLRRVDSDRRVRTHKRWIFFEQHILYNASVLERLSMPIPPAPVPPPERTHTP